MVKALLIMLFLFYYENSFSQKNELSNYNYVLLGEPTHGDGAIFDEKVKIIKKLHTESEFKTVLFEAGFYDNLKAWELYKQSNDIEVYNESIFSIWSETKAFQELLVYIKQNPEMKILGVDCQEGEVFQQYYLDDLKSIFHTNNIAFSEEEFELIDKTLIYKDLEYLKNNKTETVIVFSLYDKVLSAFNKIKAKDFKVRVLEQTFKSSKAEVEYSLKQLNGEKFPVQNPRDLQMAENFIFLQKELKNEKLILWAANYHIANDVSSFKITEVTNDYINKIYQQERELNNHNENSLIETKRQLNELNQAKPMGKILKEYYKDDLFSLGFTSYSGNYIGAHDKAMPIITPPEQSIETDFYKENKNGLIILKNYPKKEFYSSSLGYLPILLEWKNVYDGIYFIPEMYVPKMVSYEKNTETNVIFGDYTEKINGIVLDKSTKEPVNYADIYYKFNNKSVVSNAKGEFMISKNNDTDYLIVSAFGYKNDSIQISDIKSKVTFYMEPSEEESFLLDEIVIESKKILSSNEIIKKARLNVKNNYIQSVYNQNFYVSVQSYNQKDFLVYNEEALINTYNKNGMSSSSNPHKGIFGEILQFKNGTDNHNKDKWSGIGNLWVQLNRDVVLSKANVLYRTNSYDLENKETIEYDGNLVYKIIFTNNSPGVYSTGYGYPSPIISQGTIYIDTENFAVVRYEHCVVRQKNQNKNQKYLSQTYHKIIETYKEINGKYVLNFFKQIDKTNYLKEDKIVATTYRNFYLMSEDVEIEHIKKYDRPIINLKQNFKPNPDIEFWKKNNFYMEDKEYKYENCN